MRILRLFHSLQTRTGGPVAGMRAIDPLLRKMGHQIDLVCLDGRDPKWAESENIHPIVFQGSRSNGHCPAMLEWLTEKAPDYDVMIVHGCWQFQGWAAYRAFCQTGVPYVIYPHGMLDPWFNRTYPTKFIKKQIYWWWREHRVLRGARSVLFTSDLEQCLAEKSFRPCRINSQVVPYGTVAPSGFNLDDAARDFRRLAGLSDDVPFLLFLGRLHPKKGLDLLVQAWRRHRAEVPAQSQSVLVIAGPSSTPDYLEALRRQAGDEWGRSIKYHPEVTGQGKWGALRGARAMILPSHQENFGMVVAESLAAGTPVLLTTKVNTWREVCRAGAGWAEPDTEAGIVTLLKHQAGLSAENWGEMRTRAQTCFQQNFDLERGAGKLADILTTIH